MTTQLGQPPLADPDRPLPVHAGRRSRSLVIVVTVLVLAGLAALALIFIRGRHAPAKTPAAVPPVAVTTAAARVGDMFVHLETIGTVTPVYTASITSQVNGIVTAVHFQEGQRVAKGDPLLDIDSRPYRAQLRQAKGVLARDENLLGQARMDLDRYRAAWARNAVARQTLEDEEKVVQQDMGVVENDEGTVQYQQVQVDFCHVTAPIAGRVGLRLVDPGNVVTAQSTVVLAVVTQMAPITVVFPVSEDAIAQVRNGQHLAVDALDRTARKKLASGTLLAIDNQIDTTTGTVKARAIFDNTDEALFPNQFVNVRVLVETHHDAVLVPSSAIAQNGSDSFVYVIENDTAHMKHVKTDASDNGSTQVEGIEANAVVANSGFDKLREGAKVTTSSAPTPPGSAAAAGAAPAASSAAPAGSSAPPSASSASRAPGTAPAAP